jgi:hypothetical protein
MHAVLRSTYHVDRIDGVDSDQILAVNIRSISNIIDSGEVHLFGTTHNIKHKRKQISITSRNMIERAKVGVSMC